MPWRRRQRKKIKRKRVGVNDKQRGGKPEEGEREIKHARGKQRTEKRSET